MFLFSSRTDGLSVARPSLSLFILLHIEKSERNFDNISDTASLLFLYERARVRQIIFRTQGSRFFPKRICRISTSECLHEGCAQ